MSEPNNYRKFENSRIRRRSTKYNAVDTYKKQTSILYDTINIVKLNELNCIRVIERA